MVSNKRNSISKTRQHWQNLFSARWQHRSTTEPLPNTIMLFLGLIIGIMSGFGAVGFRYLIAIVHNVMFNWNWSFDYSAIKPTAPSFWGWAVIFVPVYGGIIIVFLISRYAKEAKGHGVPEVIEAIRFKAGAIRPIVAIIKAVASAISIGTGASVGREGPIAQIGATLATSLAKIIKVPTSQRIILLAAGAAGGIAATFNAPLGGLMFAIELMLITVSPESLAVVAIACATATWIGRWFFGVQQLFPAPGLFLPAHAMNNVLYLLWFIPFGCIMGFAALLFTRGIYWFEDLFNKIPISYLFRHTLAMLIVGGMMELFMVGSGRYYIEGVGYSTIVDVLRSMFTNPLLLLLLAGAKWLATCLTLGSGGSGGVFSPSLFIGATLGACCGICLNYVMPGLGISPIAFAVAGMAAMVGGSTGALITAVVMAIELTNDEKVILPVMISASVALAVRSFFCKHGIYTLKLLKRKHVILEGLQSLMPINMKK